MSCENSKQIEFTLIDEIDIKRSFKYPSQLISNEAQARHIFSQERKPLFILKDYIPYEDLDCSTFDYILSFSHEIQEIRVTKDNCDYLDKTPVLVSYKNEEEVNRMFIYQISRKGKYRNICP